MIAGAVAGAAVWAGGGLVTQAATTAVGVSRGRGSR